MIRKPWPIIFVSLIFFLIPFFNIVGTYFILKTNYSFSDYIYSLFAIPKNFMALFDMVIPSLVAGIAVYNVKKWSYPVFLLSMFWITIQLFVNFLPSMHFSDLVFSILLPMLINVVYVSYILLPNVRAIYLEPRLRWWETKPRYIFSTDVEVLFDGKTAQAKMTNISEGGLFALISTPIESNTLVNLKFEILGESFDLQAKIVYQKPDGTSHGLQFFNLTKNQKKQLKKMISRLVKEHYEETRPVPVWTEDLSNWFKTLIKTKKGIVPEIPKFYKKD